jgi:hypothetical protein
MRNVSQHISQSASPHLVRCSASIEVPGSVREQVLHTALRMGVGWAQAGAWMRTCCWPDRTKVRHKASADGRGVRAP